MARSAKRKDEDELIDLNLNSNLYISIYIVDNDEAKECLIKKLGILQNKCDVQMVDLDIKTAGKDDIHGPVVISGNSYRNEKPKWFKDTPFMLLTQNIEKLSVQKRDDLTKLNKLAHYLPPTYGSPTGQVAATIDNNSFIAAVIIEKNLKEVSAIIKSLGGNAKQAIKAIKIRENSEGRWERYS